MSLHDKRMDISDHRVTPCGVDLCTSAVAGEYDYCLKHICPMGGCTGHNKCTIHICQYKNCKNETHNNSMYCRQHKCSNHSCCEFNDGRGSNGSQCSVCTANTPLAVFFGFVWVVICVVCAL